jgi:hypothetical protein
VNDLTSLFEVHAECVQRLGFTHCLAALQTLVALDNAVVILETTEFLGFTIAAITVQLELSRPNLTVNLNRLAFH